MWGNLQRHAWLCYLDLAHRLMKADGIYIYLQSSDLLPYTDIVKTYPAPV